MKYNKNMNKSQYEKMNEVWKAAKKCYEKGWYSEEEWLEFNQDMTARLLAESGVKLYE